VVLSRPDILSRFESGSLVIEPPVPKERVAQVSIDLLLGRKFTTFKPAPAYLPAIHIDPSLWSSADLWEFNEADVFRLKPGEFVLAQTLEVVQIPSDLVGMVEGRSSWARVGITIHVTAPKIDPGFHGNITLEMANFGKVPVDLRAGIDQPAQLMLLQLTTPLGDAEAYGAGTADHFQNQTDPIPRRR
jgi:dCTP deaminase